MSIPATYDIIFAGGGTAACLVAGRLAKANPALKILILEAGKHTLNVPEHVRPALYLGHIMPGSTTATFNVAKPSEHLDGRTLATPSAKAVGGASTINFMLYTRGSASDYDDWENVHGNPGWAFHHLKELFNKTETYQEKPDLPTHGYSGPLYVSYRQMTNVGETFLKSGVQYDKTRKLVDDANDFTTVDGFSKWAKWIDRDTGRRSDTAHHFVYSQLSNQNLEVRDRATVKRVIVENGKAVGVEFLNEDPTLPQDTQTAFASRLVVVSAGAFGSPALLERSGIGARNILEKHAIDCIVDLPGVGGNYRDHTALFVPYKAADNTDTLDPIIRNDPSQMPQIKEEWETKGSGLLGHNGSDVGVKIRPSQADLAEIGPSFTAQYNEYFANAPDKPVTLFLPLSAFYGDPSVVPPTQKFFTMAFFTAYPASTGSVHISSTDPRAPVDFDSGFLSDPADLALLRWAYKRGREYARRMDLYRGELEEAHPVFASTQAAAVGQTGPVDISAPDIVYTKADDIALETYVKKFVSTSWHSMGTCAMKARDKMGVVDCNLNVYGVQNLKVADLSIAPSNVSANTYSTALVIAEKAAVIIAQELGLSL